MPDPLKNLYTAELICALCQKISAQCAPFDTVGFTLYVFDEDWPEKELKARMNHISNALYHFLPMPYSQALQILIPVSSQFSGFEYIFFPGFVELYGLGEYAASMEALAHFTQHSSSEFAVRPFIKQYGPRMMQQMEDWAECDNDHVRRLASEGCRPRLPWAMALPEFKADPAPILPILTKLKNDESEYVRRSVANNLNDISKDNPQVVVEIAQQWLGESQRIDWIVKHACRTLLKSGKPEVLELFGFLKPDHITITNFKVQKSVNVGDNLSFSFALKTRQTSLGKARLEYAIDFMKKNGKQSRKVFKISESEITIKEKQVTKSHSFKKISTRKYYPGIHRLGVIVNGCELASVDFMLS